MPRSNGTWQFIASTPLRPARARAVPILGSGDTRYIVDFIHAGETLVHQIGCHTEPNDGHRMHPDLPTTANCGLLDPS